jgi:5'-nucleotidase
LLRRTTATALVAVLFAAACGGDDEPSADATTTTTTEAVEPLTILVTNDDGIGSPGIDVLVNALLELEAVELHIVAPAENQSGTSDKTTLGGAAHTDGATASGVEGTAVDGFPADTIAVALDELGLDPDLVVSGVNEGQNSGPLAYASGTVGAGRAAVRRGIPAIAGSAGLGADADYGLATELVIDLIQEHRADYAGGTFVTEAVVNINVPDCTAGTAKELVEVPLATAIPDGVNPFESDCAVADPAELTDDILAIAAGHPALSLVPPEPAEG